MPTVIPCFPCVCDCNFFHEMATVPEFAVHKPMHCMGVPIDVCHYCRALVCAHCVVVVWDRLYGQTNACGSCACLHTELRV